MARRLLVATHNPGKRDQMLQILRAADIEVMLLTFADMAGSEPVQETGSTFLENARIKALDAASRFGLLTLADDGGLIIDALGGAPGVQSHRFMGEGTPFDVKMERILNLMSDVPEDRRACRFECALVAADATGLRFECRGVCEGRIGRERRGSFGFGYDPIFVVPEIGKHMAELPPEVKNVVSHRARAFDCAIPKLRALLDRPAALQSG